MALSLISCEAYENKNKTLQVQTIIVRRKESLLSTETPLESFFSIDNFGGLYKQVHTIQTAARESPTMS